VLQGRKRAGMFACITVTDTGGGIPEAFHEKIFDPFFRLPQGKRATEGTGLGLSLARQLARLHRGEVLVENVPGRGGSQFSVWLPVEADVFLPAEHTKASGTQADITTAPFMKWHDVREQAAVNEGPERSAQPVLLIVEDNDDIRHFVRLHFGASFRVEEACDGEEGLRKASELLPDIILSDVMMPVLDGITMCSRLKRDMNTSHIPVVLLTARGDEELQISSFSEAHADDYIVKPFRPDVLLAKLRNILALRENLRRKYYHEFLTNPSVPALESPDDAFIRQAMATVERYLDDPDFSIERFCRELGMSQTNLYRKLQSLLGISGHQFIQDIRMKRAGQLLAGSPCAVHEIALRVGFADAKYFSKAFRKYYGVLPSAYRNAHQTTHTLTNTA
jgi:CheY-like chemotaxis protein